MNITFFIEQGKNSDLIAYTNKEYADSFLLF